MDSDCLNGDIRIDPKQLKKLQECSKQYEES